MKLKMIQITSDDLYLVSTRHQYLFCLVNRIETYEGQVGTGQYDNEGDEIEEYKPVWNTDMFYIPCDSEGVSVYEFDGERYVHRSGWKKAHLKKGCTIRPLSTSPPRKAKRKRA